MAKNLFAGLSWPIVFGVLVALFVVRRLHWELTVGAHRRRVIKENGCQPVWRYPHKGLLGKMFGFDRIKRIMAAAKLGRFQETVRLSFEGHKTMSMRIFSRDFISTIEPENVKTILSTKFSDFGLGQLRAQTLSPVFGNGIFVADGKKWEHSRALIRPSFTRQQVGDLSTYEHHVQNLMARIPKDGQTFDIQDLFFGLTMDSATEFLFGKSTNTLVQGQEHPGAAKFTDAFTYVLECMTKDFRTARLNRFVPDKKRKEGSEYIRKFASDIIDEAITDQKDPAKGIDQQKRNYTFLYELLKVTNDREVLQSECLNVLLAGRDTTASLMSHTFFDVARRPDVWAKLQAEVEQLGGQVPDYETLKSMKYLKWVLNESLRLRPVVPGNSRIAIRDTFLPLGGGPDEKSPVFVPKGTPVSYTVWSMHRLTDYYGPDALEFKPERWEKLRPGWEYLPFNGGPRICIGQNFALTEASYVIVRLLQTFSRIEPRDDQPWREWQTLTLAVKDGVKIGLYER